MKLLRIYSAWLARAARNVTFWSKYRYIGLSPPHAHVQILWDKRRLSFLRIHIRSLDDYTSVKQVFINEDYRLEGVTRHGEIIETYKSILREGRTPLILDIGANIGCASLYFHRCFPEAEIVAVEPDQGNVQMIRENTEGLPVTVVASAIGSKPGRGSVFDPGLGPNGLRVERSDEGAVPITTISELLDDFDETDSFLVKVDVEGSEAELFTESTDWIRNTAILMVELHDWLFPGRGTAAPYLGAVAKYSRDTLIVGENLVSLKNPLGQLE